MLQSRITYGHNSFVLNEHFNADGTIDRSKAQSSVIVDEVQGGPGFRDLRDPYHLTTGGALGRVHKGLLALQLSGRIVVPDIAQLAALEDKKRAFLAAFDPALCYRDSPTTEGAYALDFSGQTLDTTTYPTGLIALRYYVRPANRPRIIEDIKDSGSVRFALGLAGADPRLYELLDQTLTLNAGSPTGNVVNRGTVPAPLRATITMSGAGNAAYTITRAGVAFILNLSGMANGDVVVVTFETCAPYGDGKRVTKNGTANLALKTSSPSTWLDAPVGTTSFTVSNAANASCDLVWRSARA